MTSYKKGFLFLFIALSVLFFFRIALLLMYHDSFFPYPVSSLLFCFLNGFRFDLSIILTFAALPLLLMTQPVKPDKGLLLGGWFMYFLVLLGTGLLFADLVYFDFVKRHVGREFTALKNDWGFIFHALFQSYKIIVVFFLLVASILFLIWKKILSYSPKDMKRPLLKWIVFILFIFLGIRGSFSPKSLNIIDAFKSGDTILGNLTLNGLFTLYHSSSETQRPEPHFYSDKQIHEILNLKETDYPMMISLQTRPKNINVVFVLLESWSYKYVDSFAYKNYGVTPCFDSLAEKGRKYLRFYSAGQRSIEGIQSTLTGVPILPGIPYLGYGLETSKLTHLGELAAKNGCRTFFIQSFRRRSYRMDSIAKTVGFQEYYGMEDIPILLSYPDVNSSQYGWDYETYQFLKKKLDQAREPFFAYLCTGSTHGPYPLAGKQFEKYPHANMGEGGFLNSLYYADWSLGEFMKAAKQSIWFDRTVFIFTADHPLGSFQDDSFLDKFHVPLLIYAPKIFTPETITAAASHLDIMPTILDLLGIKDEFASAGESLFNRKRDWIIMTEGDLVAILTDKGCLKHSLQNRLETLSFQPDLPEGYHDELEQKLLAFIQLSYGLIEKNKWSR
ncbi:MAG: sulfatase-like hydrolase/transferase [Candidatus Aureabacteria bacterium]|nr:sulfatase-like hydrolase/transferase [Candidatus Auribacterota bacterium]